MRDGVQRRVRWTVSFPFVYYIHITTITTTTITNMMITTTMITPTTTTTMMMKKLRTVTTMTIKLRFLEGRAANSKLALKKFFFFML